MQSIAASLIGEQKPVDFHDPDYIERVLLGLPKTSDVQRTLDGLREEQLGHVENSSPWLRLDALGGKAKVQLERCEQRDMLAEDRPEGCWCLGLGGKNRRHTEWGESFLSETCSCPEGERMATLKETVATVGRAKWIAEETVRLFGKAKVPERFRTCRLDSYPVSDRSRPALQAIRSWLGGPGEDTQAAWDVWLSINKKSLFLHGAYGVGKTGLAVAALHAQIGDEGGGLFFTVPSLLDLIRSTYGPNPLSDERHVLDGVKRSQLLVLDDLGAERVTEWVREKLFTIINHRHDEDLPTIFTSNLSIAELGEHIGERTTWRIVEMATVIHIEGPNLRAHGA